MGSLTYRDWTTDPAGWARALGISREAVELYLCSDVVDLHIDSFLWQRIFGRDLRVAARPGLLGGRFWGQADFPRVREARLTGATWVITTNPLRSARDRARIFIENLARFRGLIASVPDELRLVTTAAEYRAARAEGLHGAFIGVQGGNALDRDLEALDLLPPGVVLRITLMHLSDSRIGTASSPLRRRGPDPGLSAFGRDYVRRLDDLRVFVDLAHASPATFWDAVAVHDRSLPLLVSHTGVSGVHPHWRNLDDAQLRAVADTGGTVGIIYHGAYLGQPYWRWGVDAVVEHLLHVLKVTGACHASLGSDWDGAIVTPRDMPTCLELPVLVDRLLRRGVAPDDIQKILGGSFLRALEALRG